MSPEEVERVIGKITEKDVMDFARRKLWDQDVAVSAVGSIEGRKSLPDLFNNLQRTNKFPSTRLQQNTRKESQPLTMPLLICD